MSTAPRFDATGRPIPGLLTVKEAAQVLRVSQRKAAEMKASGILPYVQIGRSVRFRPQDLEDYILGNRFLGHRRVKGGRNE